MSEVSLSIIVPYRGTDKIVHQSLQSIIHSCLLFREKVEIILVLNGKTDFVATEEEKKFIDIIHSPPGRSKARNAGLKQSSGKYVCFVDSDCIVPKDFILEVYKTISTTPEFLGVTCKIYPVCPVNRNLELLLLKLAEISTRGTFCSTERVSLFTPFVDSAACILSAEKVKTIGGFDEKLARHEDVDLSIRLSQNFMGSFECISSTKIYKSSNQKTFITFYWNAIISGFHRGKLIKKWIPDRTPFENLRSILRAIVSDLMFCLRLKEKAALKLSLIIYFSFNRVGNILGIRIRRI